MIVPAVAPLTAQVVVSGDNVSITGVVRDRDTRGRMESANVFLPGTNIGTVTNADGLFTLKIRRADITSGLEVSSPGYLNTHLTSEMLAKSGSKSLTVWLVPAVNQLGEVYIYGGPARQIVEEALRKIPDNYSAKPNMLHVFYREIIQKGHRYMGISEAMMNVYKSDYSRRDVTRDRVQVLRGRRLLSQKADTLAVKVKGGPNLSVLVDVMKNPDALFSRETLDYYDYRQLPSVMIDDRIHYVVAFSPRMHPGYALHEGRLYIDSQRMSLTRAEYALDLSNLEQATSTVLYRKPAGLRFRPYEVSFVVSYRQYGGVTCLNYVRNVMRFKCDWKRRLFSSVYTACSEMVVVDRDDSPSESIRWRDSFSDSRIFSDEVTSYWDEDYWHDYNIIEPTESLENAVKRLRK